MLGPRYAAAATLFLKGAHSTSPFELSGGAEWGILRFRIEIKSMSCDFTVKVLSKMYLKKNHWQTSFIFHFAFGLAAYEYELMVTNRTFVLLLVCHSYFPFIHLSFVEDVGTWLHAIA